MHNTLTEIADPVYPIYSVVVRWEQDGEHNPDWKWQWEGLPEGRIWNRSHSSRMFRDHAGAADLERELLEEWPKYAAEKLADVNPSEPTVEIEFAGRESWCLTWFQHWTFDVGQDDGEALLSFQRYVNRYAHMQDYYPREKPEWYRPLMGAEDRWRWSGEGNGHPPCRCKHCKEQGVIRIGH